MYILDSPSPSAEFVKNVIATLIGEHTECVNCLGSTAILTKLYHPTPEYVCRWVFFPCFVVSMYFIFVTAYFFYVCL